MGPKKIVYPCLVCKQNVTKQTGGVKCSYCDLWCHAKCGDISPSHLQTLQELEGSNWTCKHCRGVTKKIKQEINHIQLKQSEMRADIDANITNIQAQEVRIDKVEKKLEEVSQGKLIDLSKDAVFEELRERDARKENLVIHQVVEPPEALTRGWERKDHEITQVIRIFAFLQCNIIKEEIKFIYRPGERSESGRPRPIILCLKDPGAREYILANARKLANSEFNSISIIPDLTLQQRKEEEKLRKTTEKRNREMDSAEALNWEWVLIGMRGQRRLIKKKITQQEGRVGPTASQRESGHSGRGQIRTSRPLTGGNLVPILQPI